MSGDSVKAISKNNASVEYYSPFQPQTQTGTGTTTTGMDQSIWNMGAYMYGGFENMPLTGGFGFNDFGTFDSFSYMGGMPSFCGGFPMFTGTTGNTQDYWDRIDEYNQAITENQIRQNDRRRNAELSYNAPQENVNITLGHLNEKIVTNNQDQILDAYNDFKNAVRAMYGGTEEEVNARAQTLYKQAYKVSLTEDIREHGKSAFAQAFAQTMQGGVMIDHTSAEYNVSQITGQPIGRTEADSKAMGHALGGTTFGALAGAIVGGIIGFVTKNPKIGTTIGTLVGSIGGGVIGEAQGAKKYT